MSQSRILSSVFTHWGNNQVKLVFCRELFEQQAQSLLLQRVYIGAFHENKPAFIISVEII